MIVRLVCGVLASAIILGVITRPPTTMGQTIGALLPTAMLLGFAIRGGRKSRLPKRKTENQTPR